MSDDKIIADWQKGLFKPVYWLEGEEEYFIDRVMDYAEHKILSEAEMGFNLTVFYGKDADWAAIVNACRRYPMFSEKQVVLLKEAQQMRDLDRLEAYIEKPLLSTIFVVSYKEKKVDGRTKLAKTLKEKGVVLTTRKMYDSQLPEWTRDMVEKKGFTINPKALRLVVDHIGNDLNRLENEISKLSINLGKRKSITEEDIEEYIGVSKDFNVYELQAALGSRNIEKAIRIVQYFEANPKVAPIQLILPSLYGFFSKVFMIYGVHSKDEKTISQALGVHAYFVKDYMKAAQSYSYTGIETILLLLHQYNLKSVGVNDAGSGDASLLKEMIMKMTA